MMRMGCRGCSCILIMFEYGYDNTIPVVSYGVGEFGIGGLYYGVGAEDWRTRRRFLQSDGFAE